MQNTECPLCWIEAHVGNPSNPAVRQPAFAIPPTYRTPKVRFDFLAVDHILKSVTSSSHVIARLEVLLERAGGSEVEKINNIISNIKEINKELIEMKISMERRGDLPTYKPIRFRDTTELDRRTKTETLITVAWRPLHDSYHFLARSKGSLRNLRARLLETGQTEEARDVEREIQKLTDIGKKLYEKQRQIQELKIGELGAYAGNPNGEDPEHPLKPIKFKKDVKTSKRVEPYRTPEGKHFREELSKLDPWIYHKRLTEYFKKDENEPSNPCKTCNPGSPVSRYVQRGQTLPGRQMWLLETMCRRMGVDVKLIDPMISYWENKEEIESAAHVKLHLKAKKDNHELEALARQVKAMEKEETADFEEYLRSMT